MSSPRSCTPIVAPRETSPSVSVPFVLPAAGLRRITEREKNAATRALVERSLALIDCELEIVRMELEYPQHFLPVSAPASKPLIRWNGTISELLEMAVAVHCAGRFSKPTGEPMTYADTIRFVESVYGITVADLYDRKTKLLSRQKNTSFLDEMRRVFIEEARKLEL